MGFVVGFFFWPGDEKFLASKKPQTSVGFSFGLRSIKAFFSSGLLMALRSKAISTSSQSPRPNFTLSFALAQAILKAFRSMVPWEKLTRSFQSLHESLNVLPSKNFVASSRTTSGSSWVESMWTAVSRNDRNSAEHDWTKMALAFLSLIWLASLKQVHWRRQNLRRVASASPGILGGGLT